MRRQRLLFQITLPTVLIIIAAMAGATWFSTAALQDFFLERTKTDLQIRAVLIEKQIAPLFTSQNRQQLNNLCRKIGKETDTRLTIIQRDGTVLADSIELPLKMDNHADRLEIIAALAGRTGISIRHSHTMARDMLYLAIPLPTSISAATAKPTTTGVLRLSMPITAINEALNTTTGAIIGCAIFLTIIAALITFTVSRKITRPLEKMRVSAERFADGKPAKEITLLDEQNISLEVADLATALNRMAGQLNDRLQTVTEQRNQLEAVFSSMTEAVLVVDREEKVLGINRAASRLLNISTTTAKDKPILEILRNSELLHFVHRCLASPERLEDEMVLREASGEIFVQAYGTLLRDATDHTVGALIVLNDVTRLRRLENMRRNFVANVSHELRTPITAIKGFVETLQDGAVSCPDDANRFLAIIHRHADRLNAIVEDLLTLSRIEQEETEAEIELAPGQIAQMLQNAAETCAAQAQTKDITLAVDCPHRLTANLNEPLMEQAITNLVVNAIKYSQEESEVRITATDQPDLIRIKVTDRGVGIAKEHLPRLFERFYRSDKARSRKLGGTGLGLAIVKHIVHAHHGTIMVDSTPGQGTIFSIDLPA